MRIAIDCIPLLLRSAGVKTYVYNWFRSLSRAAGADSIIGWPWVQLPDTYSHETSALSRPATLLRLAWLHALNYSGLPLADWAGPQVDVFHASHQLLNPPRKCRLTATLYDMTCWLVPETHAAANVRGARLFAERVMRRAAGLIAISHNSRQDAIRILGLNPDRIEVIYPGVADAFFEAAPVRPPGKPYILFVGTIEPRKNVDRLLDAYRQMAPSLRAEFELVVAGPAGWGNPATLARLSMAAGGVRYLGYVPEEQLPALVAGASVFVYPSLYEGFGLPVAQAMAAGVPVVTSNVSSLPEVAGDAALLVDPQSPAEIRAAVEKILLSPDLAARLSAAGRQRARQYRWEHCAHRSLEFFRRLV